MEIFYFYKWDIGDNIKINANLKDAMILPQLGVEEGGLETR